MWIPQGQALSLSSISPVAEHAHHIIDAQLSDRVTGEPGVLHSVGSQKSWTLLNNKKDFPGYPVVKTLGFHFTWHGSDPWLGTKVLQTARGSHFFFFTAL